MKALQMRAIKKAGQLRTKLKLDIFQPVNIFDTCAHLGVTVRFIDVSMEGMYVNHGDGTTPDILLSSLRPLPRRIFTCAHELGHHIFGHGTKIDGLISEDSSGAIYDSDEYLVDSFASAFLMPIAGVEAAFIKRGWNSQTASSVQFYIISSVFGIGYSTLITHCRANRIIDETKATGLLKDSPLKILQHLAGKAINKSHFKIIDQFTCDCMIDIETSNLLFFPEKTIIEGNHLRKLMVVEKSVVFIAERPGITRAVSGSRAYFIRIQNSGYVGLAENRHLEE